MRPDDGLAWPDVSVARARERLDRLVEPRLARLSEEDLEQADALTRERDWSALTQMYQTLGHRAWRGGQRKAAMRLALAQSRAARLADDWQSYLDALSFLTSWHRVSGGFVASEVWLRRLLTVEVSVQTAWLHANAWRELAVIHEIADAYDRALEACFRSLEICERFPEAPGMLGQMEKSLLQQSSTQRLRGELWAARDTVLRAAAISETSGSDDFTRGLIQQRLGGAELVIGRFQEALVAFLDAESRFRGSEANLLLTRLRIVTCLRLLGHLREARTRGEELVARFRSRNDGFRLGQALLELAEVQQDLGAVGEVRALLEQARPLFEQATGLEALRWRRHLARNALDFDGDVWEAIEHLTVVLDAATRADRRDLTRVMLSLHDLARASLRVGMRVPFCLALSRGAVVAAELQRESFRDADSRGAVQASLQEVYEAAALLHTEAENAVGAVRVGETGRADVINQLIGGAAAGPWREWVATERPFDPTRADEVFALARAAVLAIRTPDREVLLPEVAFDDRTPDDAVLDGMADIVVTATLGSGTAGVWAAVQVRERGGQWRSTLVVPPPETVPLVVDLLAGAQMPNRGVTAAQWEALGRLLLPDPSIWVGSVDHPRSVLISPDPRLWQVPYLVLRRNGVVLCDVAEVSLAPSLHTLALLRQRPGSTMQTAGSAAGLLDTGLGGHAIEEAALADWPGGCAWIEGLADVGALQGSKLLYVSGHAQQPGDAARLGPTEVSLESLAGQRLPGWVVLNGCWTGTAHGRYGRDPLSLAVGALLGGANSVIAGVGEVDSEASARVGGLLLRRLADGQSPAAALRAAQLEVHRRHPELAPTEWGGLCCIGLGR